MSMRYMEDFPLGETRELGSLSVTEEEILAFGRAYDPQPFHIDPEAARRSPFGGLVASGWQTAALAQRVLIQNFAPDAVTFGSPGIDELRFMQPVRPGDVLTLRATVIEARPSRSKPDRGLLRIRIEMVKQTGEVALSMVAMSLFGRRPAG